MLSFTQPLKGMAEFEEIEKSLEKNQGIVQITGCLESQKAHLIHGLSGKTPMRLVIAGDERQAKEIFEDLRFYDKNTMFYPAKDLLFFQADIQGNLLIRQRMCVIKALLEQKELTVVTSIDGCMDYLMPLEEIGKKVLHFYSDSVINMDVLKNKCKYQKVIVDTYWNPGSDNGRPELFTPAFRLDLFFLGYKKGLRNHDGVSLEENFGELPDNLQDYVEWVRKIYV